MTSEPATSEQLDAPGRGCIASFSLPLGERDQLHAQAMENFVIMLNTAAYPTGPREIVYRSFDNDFDMRHHVFRWDDANFTTVFENGFRAREQVNVSDEDYCNLEDFVNKDGRPLARNRPARWFVSTTISSSWYPQLPSNETVRYVFRYEIYAPGGIWVEQTLGDRYEYEAQNEVAFVGGIAPQYIRSAQMFKLTRVSGRQGRIFTKRERVNNIIHINGGFSEQIRPNIKYPIKKCKGPTKKSQDLIEQLWNPSSRRVKRETNIRYANYEPRLVYDEILINAAFRSTRTNEVYVFMENEYALIDYAPGTTNDRVVNGPHLICDSFPSLGGTTFGEYGIDCAFTTHYDNECIIFSRTFCAKIDYAPGTTNDNILKGPMTISKMFVFLKGTVFETSVDAAFESSTKDEAYLFKGNQYALINYSDGNPKLFHIKAIGDGFPSLKDTIFDKGIDAAFASHRWNEAYLFKEDYYALINFAPASTNDYIINGPKKILSNWPSLNSILPRPNEGLDVHDHATEAPKHVHDEL